MIDRINCNYNPQFFFVVLSKVNMISSFMTTQYQLSIMTIQNNALLWRHNHSIVSELNGDLFLLQGDKAYSFRTKSVHKNNISIIILNIKKYIIIYYSKKAKKKYANVNLSMFHIKIG